MGKCRFKPGWLTEYSWVQKTNDIRKAHCLECMKTIDVGRDGRKRFEKPQERGNPHRKHEIENQCVCNNFKK
ncbi:hypothetical protein DPMN_193385 [Dreissena polymorpha]|uniref:Uncharacterized protein n=1 Tax=Dreissena polymorpha TaxID=45954 RepID=A0A9D3Y6V0_DREPO|nr:hypothetical protein DPMN_193385 [Dreissena polymorpha]